MVGPLFKLAYCPFHNKRCILPPLYSRIIQKSLIDCTWSNGSILFLLPSSFPWSALSSVSSASLYISALIPSLCLFLYILHYCCFAEFHAALHPYNMFHQQLCVNSGTVWLTLHHNIRHIIHNYVTLYLYRMKDHTKLSVKKPQKCLLWKAASCLISNGWMRSVVPSPENYLNVISLQKEIWRCRVLET